MAAAGNDSKKTALSGYFGQAKIIAMAASPQQVLKGRTA